jgi:hypothetical protein
MDTIRTAIYDVLVADNPMTLRQVMRPKWERPDYRGRTIGAAVEKTGNLYAPVRRWA